MAEPTRAPAQRDDDESFPAVGVALRDRTPGPLVPLIDRYLCGKLERREFSIGNAETTHYVLSSFARAYGGRAVAGLRWRDIELWLAQYEPTTQQSYLTSIRGLTRWLVSQQLIKRDPCLTDGGGLRRMDARMVPVGGADDGPVFALIDKYLAGRRKRGEVSRSTFRNERYTLYSFGRSYGLRRVEHMGRSHVDAWLSLPNRFGREYKPSTRRGRLATLKAFTRWLTREGLLKRDPGIDFKPVSLPRGLPVVFSPEEVAAILDQCPDARGRLIVLLTIQTGLRCVEIERLQIGDTGPMHARVIGKGGHERVIYLPKQLRVALADYIAQRGASGGPLIQRHDSPVGLQAATIGRMFSAWAKGAGVKKRAYDGKTAHGGRRTAATDMLDNGAAIEQVAEVLGHADLASIRRYAKVNAHRLEGVMEGRWYGRPRS